MYYVVLLVRSLELTCPSKTYRMSLTSDKYLPTDIPYGVSGIYFVM